MFRKEENNINNVGRRGSFGRAFVYVICCLIILICLLLDVYFIMGIFG